MPEGSCTCIPCYYGLARPCEKAPQEHCHAGRDGECNWDGCPQEANNRANYQSYCPLAAADDARRGDES
jgi:hypothetical protein